LAYLYKSIFNHIQKNNLKKNLILQSSCKYWKEKTTLSPMIFNNLLLEDKIQVQLKNFFCHRPCHIGATMAPKPPHSWPFSAPSSHPESQEQNLRCLLYSSDNNGGKSNPKNLPCSGGRLRMHSRPLRAILSP
jgi:hypothetical protein